MKAEDLKPDEYYWVCHYKADAANEVLKTPVAYPRRFVGKSLGAKGNQPVYLFLDQRDRPHLAYTPDLLRYYATEAECLIAVLGTLESICNGLSGRIGVLEMYEFAKKNLLQTPDENDTSSVR